LAPAPSHGSVPSDLWCSERFCGLEECLGASSKGGSGRSHLRPVGQGEDPAMSTSSADCDTEAARNSDGADERDDPTNSTSTSSLLESDAA
jgi:hypothetical protein